MVKHLLAAVPGALAGALIGLLVQLGDLGTEGDTEQLVRRVVIGAAVWALGAVNLSFVLKWARGRQWAWGLGAAVVLGALTVALAVAGMVVLGFATRFAWMQAMALTTPAVGMWLGGAITLRQRRGLRG